MAVAMSKVNLLVCYLDASGEPACSESMIDAALLPSRADRISIVEASGQRTEHTVRDRTFRITEELGYPESTVILFLERAP